MKDGHQVLSRNVTQQGKSRNRIQQEVQYTTRRLELEKRKLCLLEHGFLRAKDELEERRNRLQLSTQEDADEVRRSCQQAKILENRLEKVLAKQNSSYDENNKVRIAIDQQRRERLTQNQVFRSLYKEVAQLTENIQKIREDSKHMNETQVQLVDKMKSLKQQLEDERAYYNQMHQTQQARKREQQRRLRELETRQHKDAAHQRFALRNNFITTLEDNIDFNHVALKKNILKTAMLNSIQRRDIRQRQKNLELFETAIADIRSSTGISDIEEIVTIFVSLEKRNYSLLTYVNTLYNQIESHEIFNRNLSEQLDLQQRQQQQAEATRQKAVEETERRIEITSRLCEEGEHGRCQQEALLRRCRAAIVRGVQAVAPVWTERGADPVPDVECDTILPLLHYLHRCLLSWKQYLPRADPECLWLTKDDSPANRTLQCVPAAIAKVDVNYIIKQTPELQSLLQAVWRPSELPGNVSLQSAIDSDSEEEDLLERPLSMKELQQKIVNSFLTKNKHKRIAQTFSPALEELSSSVEAMAAHNDGSNRVQPHRASQRKPPTSISRTIGGISTRGTLKRLTGLFNDLETSAALPSVTADGARASKMTVDNLCIDHETRAEKVLMEKTIPEDETSIVAGGELAET
eukprot:GHVQ01024996.1.p1 GENE.GHVQ01024996.1~~GHVQ01024996.1.p1  ORF type:complete len:634 (+),score=90.37 GHVQ01024996.1:3435-5336(+)